MERASSMSLRASMNVGYLHIHAHSTHEKSQSVTIKAHTDLDHDWNIQTRMPKFEKSVHEIQTQNLYRGDCP